MTRLIIREVSITGVPAVAKFKHIRPINIQRILGECLLIFSLPSKASRSFVESRGLPSDSTCGLEAQPGNLISKDTNMVFYIFISLPIGSLFKMAIVM